VVGKENREVQSRHCKFLASEEGKESLFFFNLLKAMDYDWNTALATYFELTDLRVLWLSEMLNREEKIKRYKQSNSEYIRRL
jgi:hypothetical protein